MDKLKEILNTFNSLGDLSALKREGRDFDFSDVHHLLMETYNKLQQIIQNPDFWVLLPQNIKDSCYGPFGKIANLADQIRTFNPATGATQQTRDSIAEQIKSQYGQLYDSIFIPLDTHLLKQSLSSGNIQQLAKEAKNTLKEINTQKAKGEELLHAIQETAAVGGTSKFAGIFSVEAENHKTAANWWLVVTTIAAVAIIFFLFHTFNGLTNAIQNLSVAEMIANGSGQNVGNSNANGLSGSIIFQLFFAKVLILSFLSVVFYQIAKNYNANMHLFIINKHRENSLKTFQAFVESTNDPKTKDIILVQSTQTIFSAGDTGYVSSKDSSPSFDAVKIIEPAQRSA